MDKRIELYARLICYFGAIVAISLQLIKDREVDIPDVVIPG